MEESTSRVPFWRSLQMKFALTYLAIVAVVLAVLNTYPLLRSQDSVFHSKATALQGQASVISSALAGAEGLSREGAQLVMEVLGDTGLSRVLVTDPAGLVLYDSSTASGSVGRYALLGEVAAALRGNDTFRSDFVDGAFHSRAALPVTYRGMTLGAVYVDDYDAEQGAMLLGVQQTLRSISLVISFVAVALGVLFSRVLSVRLNELLGAIRVVREGEYSHRVNLSGRDELKEMAQEFNALTDRLQATEEVRRRFVSDASHELKTPLAAIRLLTDSILQTDTMDPDTVREFVGDIGTEAGRLQRITEKLLTLTRLDAQAPVEPGAVDVSQVARRVEHMLQPVAQVGEVELHLELEEGLQVWCTADDLYQILYNLMENGVKYNRPGGWVRLTTRREGEEARLLVEDVGVGIPAEDLDRIFDRFYRVDKARSRAAGGTGLGLSIVRDTARRYGGTVEAQGQSQGTLFTVTLPLWREGGAG